MGERKWKLAREWAIVGGSSRLGHGGKSKVWTHSVREYRVEIG